MDENEKKYKKRVYQRIYREVNRIKVSEARKKYRESHREEIAAHARDYRLKQKLVKGPPHSAACIRLYPAHLKSLREMYPEIEPSEAIRVLIVAEFKRRILDYKSE